MKSLVEFIAESKNDLEKNLNILNKAISDPQDHKKICQTIKKLVDNNKADIIDTKDINSVERGMLIGYLPNKSFLANANTAIAVFCARNREWLTLHTFADKNTESKLGSRFDIFNDSRSKKLYPGLFEDGWKVIHINDEDSDLVETLQMFV